mgnify:FL=1
MVRDTLLEAGEPSGTEIRRWDAAADHERIRFVYGTSFGHEPWPADWDRFDEFDPEGVFVAEDGALVAGDGAIVAGDGAIVAGDGRDLVGFCICFLRRGEGYISVVAVLPSHRRRGIASALVRRAVAHLREQGAGVVRIDAYEDARAAVGAYHSLGFEVYDTVEDPDADPRGTAEE